MSAGAGRQFPTRHGDTHGPGRSDELPWVAEIHMSGTALPTAGRTNTGALFGLRDPSSGSIGTVYSNQSGTVWEEYPVPAAGTASGGGGPAQERVILDTPDSSGNAYPALSESNGMSNVQRLLPFLSHAGDGSWAGVIRVPADYGSAGAVVIEGYVNSTSGAVRLIVGTAVIADTGATLDASYTDETAQNVSVPGTALYGIVATFTLSTSPTAGDVLNVRVKRNAADTGDTCTAAFGVWHVYFTYTPA